MIAGAVVVVYAQVYDFAFVNFDDPAYVYENEYTTAGLTWEGVRWALTTVYLSNWSPLTLLSHMLDCELFGLRPGAHHLVSAVLHLANALLVFATLRRMTDAPWRSAFVAAVFAVHPAHAESVAWVSERKDVLSTFFGLLGIWVYIRHAREPARHWYAAALIAFGASLLSKQMLVSLPLLLLVLDVWPLRRISWMGDRGRERLGALVLEKVPFLAMALAAAAIALFTQMAGGSVVTIAARPLGARLANVVVSYVRYVALLFWPADLTFYYVYHPWPAWQVIGAGSLLVGMTAFAWRVRERHPYVLAGWLWYLISMLPVIGIVPIGEQAIADRYTYVSSIGLSVILAWGVPEVIADRRFARAAMAVAATVALALLAVAGFRRVAAWRDSETLLARALEVDPQNPIAHNNLGFEMLKRGRLEDAEAHFVAALNVSPGSARAHLNLGRVRLALGQPEPALAHAREAVRLKPDRAEAHEAVGDALARLGRFGEAAASYRRAIALGAPTPEVRNNLGVVLASGGDVTAALEQYQAALAVDPNHAAARANAARALAELGRKEEALRQLDVALRLHPDDAGIHLQMATLLVQEGRRADGISHLRRALELQPDSFEAQALARDLGVGQPQ